MIGRIAQVKIVLISRGKFPDSSGFRPVFLKRIHGLEARPTAILGSAFLHRTIACQARPLCVLCVLRVLCDVSNVCELQESEPLSVA